MKMGEIIRSKIINTSIKEESRILFKFIKTKVDTKFFDLEVIIHVQANDDPSYRLQRRGVPAVQVT